MLNKAISPLIATVLLIAFAVTLGAIVLNFSQESTMELRDEASAKIGAAADEAAAKTEAAAEDVKNASKEATAHVAGAVEQGAADVKEKAQ